MKTLRFMLFLILLMSALAFPLAASADHIIVRYVSVTLRIAEVTYYTPRVTCTLSVGVPIERPATGVDVLETARKTGCISSYELDYYSFGAFVRCIDGVCGDPAPTYLRYWSMREWGPYLFDGGPRRCDPTEYGVSDFIAENGKMLSFTYETAATGLAPAIC